MNTLASLRIDAAGIPNCTAMIAVLVPFGREEANILGFPRISIYKPTCLPVTATIRILTATDVNIVKWEFAAPPLFWRRAGGNHSRIFG
jgi:hypothetical protein